MGTETARKADQHSVEIATELIHAGRRPLLAAGIDPVWRHLQRGMEEQGGTASPTGQRLRHRPGPPHHAAAPLMRCQYDQVTGVPFQVIQACLHRIRALRHDLLHPNAQGPQPLRIRAIGQQPPCGEGAPGLGKRPFEVRVRRAHVHHRQVPACGHRQSQGMQKSHLAVGGEVGGMEDVLHAGGQEPQVRPTRN